MAAALAAYALAACSGSGSGSPQQPNLTEWAAPEPPTSEQTTYLGLKWNWSQGDTAAFAADTAAGVTFHKTEWCDVQPEPDAPYEWSAIDRIVDAAQDLGYAPMLKIRVGACWASDRGESDVWDSFEGNRADPSGFPADEAAYERYVADFVARYTERGVRVYAIENEVDALNFWRGPISDYERLARIGSDVIRQVDPEAIVLDAGPSSTGLGIAITADLLDQGRETEALDFYSAYYERRLSGGISRFPSVTDTSGLREVVESAAGVRAQEAFAASRHLARDSVIDAYQLHFYESTAVLPEVLAWLTGQLPEGFPIQAWEVGVAWPGAGYDDSLHTDETARLLAGLLAERVAPAVYLPLAFTPGPGKQQVFRGLIEPDGTELPAADAYRAVRDLVAAGDWQPVAAAELTGIAAPSGEGSSALVWTRDPDGTVPIDDPRISLRSVSGEPSTALESRITHRPVVLEAGMPVEALLEVLVSGAN